MAFRALNFEEGRLVRLPVAAATMVKGDAMVDNGSGFLTPATGGNGTQIEYIAAATVATTPTEGDLHDFYRVGPSVRISADCDAAPAQTDVGTYCDLAAAGSLNPDASTDDLFYIESIDLAGGAVGTSTVVTGYFTQGAPGVE